MPRAVARGWGRRQLESLRHLGLEEKSFQRGPSYITLLTDWDEARVVEVVEDRTKEAAEKWWETLTPEQKEEVAAVAVARGEPFIQTVQQQVPAADVVPDKFQVSQYLHEAVDPVRRQEHKPLLAEGDETLTGRRPRWLYNPQNFSAGQAAECAQLKDLNLKAGRAWAAKELLSKFWAQEEEGWARRFFKDWLGG